MGIRIFCGFIENVPEEYDLAIFLVAIPDVIAIK
jgi:hypothetical protein